MRLCHSRHHTDCMPLFLRVHSFDCTHDATPLTHSTTPHQLESAAGMDTQIPTCSTHQKHCAGSCDAATPLCQPPVSPCCTGPAASPASPAAPAAVTVSQTKATVVGGGSVSASEDAAGKAALLSMDFRVGKILACEHHPEAER